MDITDRKDLLYRLRSDMNGVPLEDIPDFLRPLVGHLEELGLVHTQDKRVLKPNSIYFSSPDQLEADHRFPFDILEACGHENSTHTMVSSGKARIVDHPIVGRMVVII